MNINPKVMIGRTIMKVEETGDEFNEGIIIEFTDGTSIEIWVERETYDVYKLNSRFIFKDEPNPPNISHNDVV